MTCDLISFPIPTIDPYDPNSILNPAYNPDTGCIEPGFRILIYVGTTPWDFSCFYNPPSMEIEENRGFERGFAQFKITDYSPTAFNLPFIPLVDQKIEIWNRNQTDLFFEGRIADVEPNLIVRRCDGTEVMYFEIKCSDMKIDLERILVSERYENVHTGFIVKDVITRFTFFDASAIDPLSGQLIKDIRFNHDYVSQVIERILDLEPTWTFWIETGTRRIRIGETGLSYNTIANATETNVYDLFDAQDLVISTDSSIVRNRIYFWYNQRYASGLVSVTLGSNVVFGTDTEFTRYVQEGAEIRINNSVSTYTVERIFSDVELRISSPYQDIDVISTNVPFEITGSKSAIIVEDSASIALMAAINNETGPLAGLYEYKVPDESVAYTREQALQIAKAHLLRYIEPLIKGKAKTNNTKLPTRGLHAGQVINFNLPVSRKVSADVVIQQIRKRDTGALLCRVDTEPGEDRIDPYMIYDIDFQDRVFDTRNQIKRIMADVREIQFGDTTLIENVKIITENVFIQDCVDIIEPIGGTSTLEISDSIDFIDPTTFTDELEIEDTIALIIPPAGPYFTTPTPRQAGFCIGVNNFGFTS